jgi:hypothetical protein
VRIETTIKTTSASTAQQSSLAAAVAAAQTIKHNKLERSNYQMKTKSANIPLRTAALAAAAVLAILFAAATSLRADAVEGAIFSTDSTCTSVDLNIYTSKDAVYIDGGPKNPGAAGLPDGSYCVQVTQPDGTVLGVSAPGAVSVSGGEFAQCYQLSLILNTASSGFTTPGYDDTANSGGEYKVWVSTDCNFVEANSKTDNFKVRSGGGPGGIAEICVTKFYDANANGTFDPDPQTNPGEQVLDGWQYKVFAADNLNLVRYTGMTPGCLVVNPDTYHVIESDSIEPNWVHTTPTDVAVTAEDGKSAPVEFGNVCLGAGNGLTLGFWSNKNGQSLETASDFCFLNGLNLRNANGSNYDPIAAAGCPAPSTNQLSAAKTSLSGWLLGATATNMAYMLSAQLATMELNVLHPTNKYNTPPNTGVSGTAVIYEECLKTYPSLTTTGFITINALMVAANTELGLHGNTTTASAARTYQECLKNALDDANNNKSFVQTSDTHCPYSFAPTPP